MINTTVLTGRLTRDADLRYTSNGTATASFSLAVDRNFKNANGERDTDFINCVAWRKTAETLAQYTRKGSLIGVEGRIQTRTYDNKEGRRVYVTEVVVEEVTFLESKNASKGGSNGSRGNYSRNNQSGSYDNSDPFNKVEDEVSTSDDSLPF